MQIEAKDIAERMKAAAAASLKGTGMDMAFAQVSVNNDDVSVGYLVPSPKCPAYLVEYGVFDRRSAVDRIV